MRKNRLGLKLFGIFVWTFILLVMTCHNRANSQGPCCPPNAGYCLPPSRTVVGPRGASATHAPGQGAYAIGPRGAYAGTGTFGAGGGGDAGDGVRRPALPLGSALHRAICRVRIDERNEYTSRQSGILVGPTVVLTAAHGMNSDSTEVYVAFPAASNTWILVTVRRVDHDYDIVILDLSSNPGVTPIPYRPILPAIGSSVTAIGYPGFPLGLPLKSISGRVMHHSAKNATLPKLDILTDINNMESGMSGGPFVDTSGNVVGIISSASSGGSGAAIKLVVNGKGRPLPNNNSPIVDEPDLGNAPGPGAGSDVSTTPTPPPSATVNGPGYFLAPGNERPGRFAAPPLDRWAQYIVPPITDWAVQPGEGIVVPDSDPSGTPSPPPPPAPAPSQETQAGASGVGVLEHNGWRPAVEELRIEQEKHRDQITKHNQWAHRATEAINENRNRIVAVEEREPIIQTAPNKEQLRDLIRSELEPLDTRLVIVEGQLMSAPAPTVPSTPSQPVGKRYATLIVRMDADYWGWMENEVAKTQGRFGIRIVEAPVDHGFGVLPKLVFYEAGTPITNLTVSGVTEVRTELRRIRGGQLPY